MLGCIYSHPGLHVACEPRVGPLSVCPFSQNSEKLPREDERQAFFITTLRKKAWEQFIQAFNNNKDNHKIIVALCASTFEALYYSLQVQGHSSYCQDAHSLERDRDKYMC